MLKEASDGVVTLDDEDREVFERFKIWLYTGRLLEDEDSIDDLGYHELFDLYIFAEKRVIPRLQNACIDLLLTKESLSDLGPTNMGVAKVWDNTPDSSPMRKLILDWFVHRGNMSNYLQTDEDVETHSKDFLASLVRAYYTTNMDGLLEEDWDPWENRCGRYHTHHDGNPVCC